MTSTSTNARSRQIVDLLKATGAISPHDRRKNSSLLNAVGLSDRIQVDSLFVDLHKGDRVLICSDGIHGQVETETEIAELLRTGAADAAASALVRRAGLKGRDNATAVVIEVGERFVKRYDDDRGIRSRDLERAQLAPLFAELPLPLVMAALAGGCYASVH